MAGCRGVLGVLIRVRRYHVGEPLLPLRPGVQGGPPAGYGRHPGVKRAPPVSSVRIHLVQVVAIQYILFTFWIRYGCLFVLISISVKPRLTWHHRVISKRLFNR